MTICPRCAKPARILSPNWTTALSTSGVSAQTAACLITKNNTNPFFVKMKEGASAKAAEAGIDLSSYAGKVDGDAAPQINAIENCWLSSTRSTV